MMRYWWVNQNQTYKHEVQGGFLWSPKVNRNGRRNQFYDNMTLVSPGDVVLSFCDTQIKAIGIATGVAVSAEKPNFGTVGDQWDNEGWLITVEFQETDKPVRPKDFIEELRPQLTGKYDPLQTNGTGNQGVYLAEITKPFFDTILGKMGVTLDEIADSDGQNEQADQAAQQSLEGRTDIGETQKQQLVLARRGQGIFKANVRLNEAGCRVTGVKDPRLLVASHIKPWAASSDREKLDGCNGLLLSPHVDRLFDRGWITFDDDGTLIKSPHLDQAVMEAWGMTGLENVGAFTPKQSIYLNYHRTAVFKGV